MDQIFKNKHKKDVAVEEERSSDEDLEMEEVPELETAGTKERRETRSWRNIASSPITKELRVRVSRLSDTDSECSVASSGAATSRHWRKRTFSDDDLEMSEPPKGAAHKSKRGRGRPPTTGEYVGLAEARAQLNAAKAEELRLEAEASVGEMSKTLRDSRHSCRSALNPPTEGEDTAQSLAALYQLMVDAAATVEGVAGRSKNLKGTSVKALKDAAGLVKEAAAGMRARTINEEVAKLELANRQLTAKLAELSREVAELRKQPAAPPPPATPDTSSIKELLEQTTRASIAQFSAMLNARFDGIESRLLPEPRLRPPLAADRRRAEAEAAAAVPPPPQAWGPRPPAAPSAPPAPPVASKGKGKGKMSMAAREARAKSLDRDFPELPAPAPPPPPTANRPNKKKAGQPPKPQAAKDNWQVVGGAKKGKKRRKKRSALKRREAARLRPPTTTAVVITLQSGAEARGVSYNEVMKKAKTFDLTEVDIPEVRCRITATGARLLEVDGETSGPKADALAERLRALLPAEDVRISRPCRTLDLRIIGLDDAVTVEELRAAVARAGVCSLDHIKAGVIRRGPTSLGTAVVSCPVEAAQRLAEKGRLLVGWVSAQVRLLKPRPLRCFRCLMSGHVGVRCASGTDCSNSCFRCGNTGHQASACSAEPHCPACVAIGKDPHHWIGSKDCAANKPQGRKGKGKALASGKPPSQPEPTQAPAAAQEVPFEMECL